MSDTAMHARNDAWRHAHHESCFEGCDKLLPNGVPQSFDSRDWAREFCRIADTLGHKGIDEAWMQTWFANALMRGWDEHAKNGRSMEAPTHDLARCAARLREAAHYLRLAEEYVTEAAEVMEEISK